MTPAELLELQEAFKLEHPTAPAEMLEAWLELQGKNGEKDERNANNP
jgi:hypothetical protein